MRPLPRQKIYKFSFLNNLINFFTMGMFNNKKTAELNHYLQNFFNCKNILCLNRGRLGAYLAVKASLSNKKNKIILSPFTIFDVVNMVISAGAKPVFCDVEKKSITINMSNIIKMYDENVAAILITHTHVMNEDIEKIITFCKEKNIFLIEDCAISFGTKFNNKFIGTLGDISFFSFGIFKFISSLNGGMVMTKNNELYEKILIEYEKFKYIDYKMLLKNFFKSIFITILTNKFIFKYFSSFIINFGYFKKNKFINNFSKNDPNPYYLDKLPNSYKKIISPSQSATILRQIPNYLIDFRLRIENAKIYYAHLRDIKEISIPNYEDSFNNGWINFPIMYKKRDLLLSYLFKNNRDLAIYFYRNCNDLKIFNQFRNDNLKVIEEVVNELIVLPTYPRYEKKQVMENIKLINKFFNK